jgi:hypothetical protein
VLAFSGISAYGVSAAPFPDQSVGREARTPTRSKDMAKGQQKKTKEARKPKKEAPPKGNASNPSMKDPVQSVFQK